MASLKRQLHDAISSVEGLGTALCVSGTELAPLPCVGVTGAGDLSLPLTQARLRNSLQPIYALADESNVLTVPADRIYVNANFDAAVQQVAQRHCRELGMRATKQQQIKQEPTSPPLVIAKLRSLVVVWSSNAPCTVPHSPTETQNADNKNNINQFGCLLFQLPAAHQGGTLSVRSTSEGVKEEVHDMSVRSEDLFHAASFYIDSVSHSIAPVTSGAMPFLVYDLHLTDACVHVPSPSSYAALTASMTQLVSQWTADKEKPDMYAVALDSKSRRVRDLRKDMSERNKSRVQLLKDCPNVSAFIVLMSKVVRVSSEKQVARDKDRQTGHERSDIEEVEVIKFESLWYTPDLKPVPVDGTHKKLVKNCHMLGQGEKVFERYRDRCIIEDYITEKSFIRNIVVFCSTDRLARMALSVSLKAAGSFVEKGMCTHADVMEACREYKGQRKESTKYWVHMANKALSEQCKADVVSLLTLLDTWQTSGGETEMEHDDDEWYDERYNAWAARVFRDEGVLKAISQVTAVYGDDDAVMLSIVQLMCNADKCDAKYRLQLADTLIPMPSPSSSSVTQSSSPFNHPSDRIASAFLGKIMSSVDLGSDLITLITRLLDMTLQNASSLPLTFGLRYDLVTNLVSRSTPSSERHAYVSANNAVQKHPACVVLQHPAVQQDLSLTQTAIRSLKLDQCIIKDHKSAAF